MSYYENLIIIDPDLGEKEIGKATERVRYVIIKSGGEVIREESMGVKKLAYNVKKHKNGLYVLLIFKAPPSTILELERFYKVFDPVLKFLIVKLRKKETAALLTSLKTSESEIRSEPTKEEVKESV